MERIRVAIDPILIAQSGSQIHWALRQILSACGWAWEETSLDAETDLAFTASARETNAKLTISADPAAWQHPGKELELVQRRNGFTHLVYKDSAYASFDGLQRLGSGWLCGEDIIFDYYWLVTGQQEKSFRRDGQGFVDLSDTAFENGEILRQAVASQIGCWLQSILIQSGCPQPLPRWPGGKKAAVFSGHDVDYPEIIRYIEPLRVIARQGLKGLGSAAQIVTGKKHHWHFPAWMQMEKSFGFTSAFYFVPRQGSLLEYAFGTPDSFYDIFSPKFLDLFKALSDEGFEVGMHASYLAYQSAEKMAAEKRRLEEASKQAVVGNRHHYWHLNPQDPEETLLFHEKAGFRYDSSLVNDRYLGWRRHSSWPFFPYHQAEKMEIGTLQMSVVWMDDQLFGFKANNPGDNMALLDELADTMVEQSGCVGIDIHDYVFDDRLHPGWSALYQRFLTYLSQRSDIWLALPRDVCQHWIDRYQSLLRHSQGLSLGLHKYLS